MLVLLFIIFSFCAFINAYPAQYESERISERELQYARPGAHQLATWLASQLRRNEYDYPPQEVPVLPYRLPANAGKRNSELTNSIMGIPRNMIDNGKK